MAKSGQLFFAKKFHHRYMAGSYDTSEESRIWKSVKHLRFGNLHQT